MRYDVLGDLAPDGDSGDRVATIPYESRQVKIHIIPDDQAFETTSQLAAAVA